MSSSPTSGGWTRRALVWACGWLVAAALYLLLIDTTDLPELVVGAGAAALAVAAFALGRRQYVVAEAIRGRWLSRALRPLAKVPSDTAMVSWTALRQLSHPRAARGEFRVAHFGCGEAEAGQVGRWALAESLGSLAPNTIIVGVDPERELILAHQLRRSGGPETIDLIGLG